jgi:peptidoglycan/xylan/chitin deacetylase (PgdA/CDA1 family)
MSREEEREFLVGGTKMVEAATGQRPIGYNCNWLRRGPNTLSLLQELGYLYHIDDLSRDEPFIETVDGKDFVVVPYTLRNNDILLVEGRNYSPAKFVDQIKMDFDQLYEEAGHRRRMVSVSAHDRISGTPQMARAWDVFLRYVKEKPGVAFLRKDAIARWSFEIPLTLRESETSLAVVWWRFPRSASVSPRLSTGVRRLARAGRARRERLRRSDPGTRQSAPPT